MKYIYYWYLLLVLLIAVSRPLQAQQINQLQEKVIKDLAFKKVKHYTRSLETLASIDRKDRSTIENLRARLHSMCENQHIRVYEDFIPDEALGESKKEKTGLLDGYLKNLHLFYPDNSLELTYTDYEISDVYFDADKERYFVKVTGTRRIKGHFYHANELTPFSQTKKIDYYLFAMIKNEDAYVSNIFEIDENKPNTAQFLKAVVSITSQSLDKYEFEQKIARLNAEPLAFKPVKESYRRDKTYTIDWQGGTRYDLIQLELVPENKKLKPVPLATARQNTNQYEWNVSTGIKPGTYRILMQDITQPDLKILSDPVRIKRKYPLALKAAAGAVVTGGLVFIISTLSNNGGSEGNKLPDPPKPNE